MNKSNLLTAFYIISILGVLSFSFWFYGWNRERQFNLAQECKAQGYKWSHYTNVCLKFN